MAESGPAEDSAAPQDQRGLGLDAGPSAGSENGQAPDAETASWSGSADALSVQLEAISAALQDLAASTGRYHERAEQREAVIDHLRDETERLRRGERRGLLRPLLVEICRLRDDLLREATGLPADFTAERASKLLVSYADSVELTLENNGVVAFTAEDGAAFDPRRHRRVGWDATADPALVGLVARTRRSGYIDVDAGNCIAPAEVVVFMVSDEPEAPDPAVGSQEADQQ